MCATRDARGEKRRPARPPYRPQLPYSAFRIQGFNVHGQFSMFETVAVRRQPHTHWMLDVGSQDTQNIGSTHTIYGPRLGTSTILRG